MNTLQENLTAFNQFILDEFQTKEKELQSIIDKLTEENKKERLNNTILKMDNNKLLENYRYSKRCNDTQAQTIRKFQSNEKELIDKIIELENKSNSTIIHILHKELVEKYNSLKLSNDKLTQENIKYKLDYNRVLNTTIKILNNTTLFTVTEKK
jgi:hypothetical protein